MYSMGRTMAKRTVWFCSGTSQYPPNKVILGREDETCLAWLTRMLLLLFFWWQQDEAHVQHLGQRLGSNGVMASFWQDPEAGRELLESKSGDPSSSL